MAHWCACIYLYIGHPSHGGEWLDRSAELADVGFGLGSRSPVWQQYLTANYFVMATFTTNGLVGVLIPGTYEEAVFVFFLQLLNMTVSTSTSAEFRNPRVRVLV